MPNPLYNSMNQPNQGPFAMIQDLKNQIQQLKSTGIDPNQKIQEMLNRGQISQNDYNNAVQKATMIQKMLGR